MGTKKDAPKVDPVAVLAQAIDERQIVKNAHRKYERNLEDYNPEVLARIVVNRPPDVVVIPTEVAKDLIELLRAAESVALGIQTLGGAR